MLESVELLESLEMSLDSVDIRSGEMVDESEDDSKDKMRIMVGIDMVAIEINLMCLRWVL